MYQRVDWQQEPDAGLQQDALFPASAEAAQAKTTVRVVSRFLIFIALYFRDRNPHDSVPVGTEFDGKFAQTSQNDNTILTAQIEECTISDGKSDGDQSLESAAQAKGCVCPIREFVYRWHAGLAVEVCATGIWITCERASLYLDNAATSFPKPDCVCDAVDRWMRAGAASAGRGSHRGTDDAAKVVDNCRRQVAQLLGVCSASQIVFTLNCTDSLNTVIQGFLRQGDRVIASDLDHNSVLRPLHAMQERSGVLCDLVGFDPVSGLIDVEDFARRLAGPPVRLVILNHASNVTGGVQPVVELTQMAHAAGAAVLLDAAQTAGHWPIDMLSTGVEFLSAAGHKGLLGPLGTGVLCIRQGLENQLQPLRFGGTGTSSERMSQPETMPARFESGNLNLPGIAGLEAATNWILERGVETLQTHLSALTQRLLRGLGEIRNVRLLTPTSAGDIIGIVSFNINCMDCRDVAMILDQSFDIQCRAGLHCAPLAHQTLGTIEGGGTIRFSPGVFTHEEDIDAAIAAVRTISDSL